MKIFFILTIITLLFSGCEIGTTNDDVDKLHTFQTKFLNIDINDDNLDLDKAIKEIKEARKLYPLDNKLKMVDIELEHKKANK